MLTMRRLRRHRTPGGAARRPERTMIRKNCDNCDRLLEVPEDQAGTKVRCPDCGDMNVIPDLAPAAAVAPVAAFASGSGAAARESGPATGPAAEPDRAAAAGYPPDAGPEQRVLRVRPAWFRSRPIVFALVALAMVGGFAGAIYFWQVAEANRQWGMWPCLVLAVVMLGVLLWWWVQTLSAALEVTNKRTVERRGLLSRATSEVLHDTIRNVTIKQSFWDRVWGVGEIGIASAGHDGIEIHIDRIPNPNKVREVIDLYRPL